MGNFVYCIPVFVYASEKRGAFGRGGLILHVSCGILQDRVLYFIVMCDQPVKNDGSVSADGKGWFLRWVSG